MRAYLWFAAGFLAAALLLRTPTVEAAVNLIAFGSFNNLPKPLAVTTDGYVQLVIN